jgi:hypothetical protein
VRKLVIPILAIVFAAFCVWLFVRLVNRREKWAKRTVVAMLGLTIYVAGFGPACWLVSRNWLPLKLTAYAYAPLFVLIVKGPGSVASRLDAYAKAHMLDQSCYVPMIEATVSDVTHRWHWSAGM